MTFHIEATILIIIDILCERFCQNEVEKSREFTHIDINSKPFYCVQVFFPQSLYSMNYIRVQCVWPKVNISKTYQIVRF